MRVHPFDAGCAATLVAVALVGWLAGCEVRMHVKSEENGPTYQNVLPRNIYVDPGTGCHYIASEQGGITPRLNIEGHPMCGTVVEKKKVQKDT